MMARQSFPSSSPYVTTVRESSLASSQPARLLDWLLPLLLLAVLLLLLLLPLVVSLLMDMVVLLVV